MIRDDGNEIAGMMDVEKLGGMRGQTQAITVAARGASVIIALSECTYDAGLDPAQARFLARKLYRMARLAEQRRGQA